MGTRTFKDSLPLCVSSFLILTAFDMNPESVTKKLSGFISQYSGTYFFVFDILLRLPRVFLQTVHNWCFFSFICDENCLVHDLYNILYVVCSQTILRSHVLGCESCQKQKKFQYNEKKCEKSCLINKLLLPLQL